MAVGHEMRSNYILLESKVCGYPHTFIFFNLKIRCRTPYIEVIHRVRVIYRLFVAFAVGKGFGDVIMGDIRGID